MSRLARRPAVLLAPEQGWSSLLLLLLLLLLLGRSIAEARPLPIGGHGSLTATLPILMVAAGLIGVLLARSSLGVVRAHVAGAAVGAILLLLVAGGALLDQPPLPLETGGLGTRVEAVWTSLGTEIATIDAGEGPTPGSIAFLLLGAVCWTTAQFGAFSVFRYDRAGPAVIAIGTVLFLNVGLDALDAGTEALAVLPLLAVFSALSMLLLMRLQLTQQQAGWTRRHISDAGDVRRLFLRTGLLFVLGAVVGASTLTAVASADPVELDFGALEEPLQDVGKELGRWLDRIGVPGATDVAARRPPSSRIESRWEPGIGTAFTARVPSGRPAGNYWTGWAEDRFDPAGAWSATTSEAPVAVAAYQDLAPLETSRAGGDLPVETTLAIGDAEGSFARVNVFRLPDATTVGGDVRVTWVDDGRGVNDIVHVRPLGEGDAFEVSSSIRDYRPDSASLTESMLRAADGGYPDWVEETYLQGRNDPAVVGPPGSRVRRLAGEIFAAHPTAYDRAFALQQELRRGAYVTDLTGKCEGYDGVAECTLAIREGFCQQYATTMALVLRQMGIPSRFVTGYLPGDHDAETGTWTVEQAAFHNWVEVWFPDRIGWVRFEPTPGGDFGRSPTRLPEGEATPDPTDDPALEPEETEAPPDATPEPSPPAVPADAAATGGGGGGVVATVIGGAALAAFVLMVAGLLLLARLRRLPGGDAGLAYRGIVSLASRLGHGPHPAQTEYEFAATLAEVLPSVREDLAVVAAARVETAYGARRLDRERRGSLRSAYARVRTALLRLWLRLRR